MKLGSGTLSLKAGKSGPIKVKLSSAGRTKLKRTRRLVLALKISGRDGAGQTVTRTVKVTVKRARR